MTFFQIFFNIQFHIGLEAMYIEFSEPMSIIADFNISSQKIIKKPKKPQNDFFPNIQFLVGLEAMYIKFGDPKSIIADYQFKSKSEKKP